ncbi:hypothetical protein [Mycoplasma sp. P36-A1]|uniref:hypothetical protein n=1 Tax=Mycoplasma sp. P36-A1 TaxID=3252900 RepID=UPI003C2B9B68
MDWFKIMQFLVLLGFVAIIVSMFFLTYYLNNNTEKPLDIDMADCGGCHNISCGHYKAERKNKEEN